MPKFKLSAYEEVYYSAEIEAEDEDKAEELFMGQLRESHPYETKHNFEMLKIKKICELQESENA